MRGLTSWGPASSRAGHAIFVIRPYHKQGAARRAHHEKRHDQRQGYLDDGPGMPSGACVAPCRYHQG